MISLTLNYGIVLARHHDLVKCDADDDNDDGDDPVYDDHADNAESNGVPR